jgi:hypothetical protein
MIKHTVHLTLIKRQAAQIDAQEKTIKRFFQALENCPYRVSRVLWAEYERLKEEVEK